MVIAADRAVEACGQQLADAIVRDALTHRRGPRRRSRPRVEALAATFARGAALIGNRRPSVLDGECLAEGLAGAGEQRARRDV